MLKSAVLPLVCAGLLLAACDDPTEVDEHPEAEGVAIVAGTGEIYRYMRDDETVPTLDLTVGVHDVAIIFLDHEGNPVPHDEDEDEEELVQVTIGNTALLTWTPEPEDPNAVHEHLEFHGELEAHDTGSTTLQICLLHAGHCDFRVEEPGIPVTVTQ